MENILPDNRQDQSPEIGMGQAETADQSVVFSGGEDFTNEFSYENFERMTGKTYQEYLRFYDDMT